MENTDNLSSHSHKNTLKFNSELFTRPFSSIGKEKDKSASNQINSKNQSYIHEEDKFSNSFYSSELHNTSKFSNILDSFTSTQKNFKELEPKNSTRNSDIGRHQENLKSRKPFEKLSFTSSSLKNETVCSLKHLEDTELPNRKHDDREKDNMISDSLTTEYMEDPSNLNKTNLTEDEKFFIKTQSETLSKDTFEKAKLYNMLADSDSIPFWIKFFSDIETNSINSNSSYFKVTDKDRYVTTLIELVKRDAELYEATIKHENAKQEVKNNIKSLLITEINEPLVTKNSSSENKFESQNLNGEDYVKQNNTNKDDDKINGKLTQILFLYDKLDEKENQINRRNNISSHLSEKQRSHSKKRDLEFSSSLASKVSYNANEFELNSELEYKLIDNLKYNDDDDEFKELNYEDIEFGSLRHQSIKRLLEIDRKLNKINPKVYKQSINFTIKNLSKDFVTGKNQRLKEINHKIELQKNQGVINQNSKTKSKNTIFDIKFENNEKIKYKDYMKEEKLKRAKQNKLDSIDEQIISIRTGPVDEEKRKKLIKELEQYHEKAEDILAPDNNEDIIDKQFEEIEERQKMKEYLIEKFEENLKKTEKIHKEQITQWKKELEGPYLELMSVIDIEYNENKKMMDRAENIQRNIETTERSLEEISKIL